MRTGLTILAFLAWQSAGWLTVEAVPQPPSVEGVPGCCCCAAGAECACGCETPQPADSSGGSDTISLCSCGDPLVPIVETSRIQLERPRPSAGQAPVADIDTDYQSLDDARIQATAHGPPPDLSHIRTVILLA